LIRYSSLGRDAPVARVEMGRCQEFTR